MQKGYYDPSVVVAESGLQGEYDDKDEEMLKVFLDLVWYLKGTDEAEALRRMMVTLTTQLFP